MLEPCPASVALVTSSAAAHTRSATENVDKCALSLQVCKFGGTQRRIRGLGLGNGIRVSDGILNVCNPHAQIRLRTDVRRRIARRVVNRRRDNLDDARRGNNPSQGVGCQIAPDG